MQTTDDQSELFVVIDKTDHVIGYKTRYACHHDKTLIHRASNLVIFDDKGRTLVQQRSATKDIRPGYWANAVGGHVTKGESYKQAIQRELQEELGIIAPVRFYKKFIYSHAQETEMETVFTAVNNGPFYPNTVEVSAVKFMSKEELRKHHQSGTLQLTELSEHIFKLIGYL